VFNLPDLSALPPEYELEEMATKNTIGSIADIKSVVFKSEAKKFNVDEFVELEKLSQEIQNISSETIFTSLLKTEEKKKSEGEASIRKSAFDILEEFVNKDASLKQNLLAIHSETLMNVVDPKVIDIDQEGVIFNAPEIDEEFEAQRALEMAQIDQEFEAQNLAQEALELEAALDLAFEQLTGQKLQENELDMDVDGEIKNLDLSVDLAIMKGKEFDLDLSFLNEVSEEQIISSDEN
jgi:segregation and condensation protein B